MYLTSSRPDIMFEVCACARYQVNQKVSHLHAMKRIFRYLKGQPKLGLWYLKDLPFDLVAYTDSDYIGASLDRKSTTGGYQFLGCRLISWQCKKQNVVANSITEAEYVAASSCYGQVLWIQNQLLDYGDSNEKKLIQMIKIYADKNVADLLTKAFDVINAAWHKLNTVGLVLLLKVNAARHKVTTDVEREIFKLEDAKGVDCLPNSAIFEQLTLMGAKTTTWNEFSSTMASVIICLATNQKFNFSKYIFESMVKNLDSVGNFLMYPRFIQVFLDKQLEEMPTHKRIYTTPSHTKKIFGNMRRVGKGFSGRETSLFPTIVVQAQAEMGEGLTNPTDPHHTPTITQPSSSQPQKKQTPRKPLRKNIEVPQPSGSPNIVADEVVYKERDDSLVRAATTASSLEAELDSGNINKTLSKATLNEPSSSGTSLGSGPRCQETMGDASVRTRFERVSKLSNDPLLARGNTLRSGEDILELKELIEQTKTAQDNETAKLKKRVKKLKQKRRSRTHGLKRLRKVGMSRRVESSRDEEDLGEDASKQGRKPIDAIDEDDNITLVSTHNVNEEMMFDVSDLAGEEVKRIVFKEPVELTTTTTTRISSQQPSKATVQDKGKVKMVKPETVKKFLKKDQIRLNEELAFKLQAEKEEEERLSREKDEANVALTEEWNDIQAKIEADQLLAERLQAREQEELTIEKRAKLFQQLLEKRRKHFAVKRAKEQRNKPPNKAQQKKTMITYLKNMEAFKRMNTFVDYRTEVIEESSKKAEVEVIDVTTVL
ncbi:hypothetical protein Tco_1099757 [Tanacetum coccineum]